MSVRMALLALLDEGAQHGYQLKAEFEARTGSVWRLNVGQVYTTLERLHRDGLVVPVVSNGPKAPVRNQRAFAITRAGKKALGEWLKVESVPDVPRDELLVKVVVTAARDPGAALDVIAAQRVALFSQLQAHRRSKPRTDLGSLLVHDALAVRAEADLTWLDRCEARLRRDVNVPKAAPKRAPREGKR